MFLHTSKAKSRPVFPVQRAQLKKVCSTGNKLKLSETRSRIGHPTNIFPLNVSPCKQNITVISNIHIQILCKLTWKSSVENHNHFISIFSFSPLYLIPFHSYLFAIPKKKKKNGTAEMRVGLEGIFIVDRKRKSSIDPSENAEKNI